MTSASYRVSELIIHVSRALAEIAMGRVKRGQEGQCNLYLPHRSLVAGLRR